MNKNDKHLRDEFTFFSLDKDNKHLNLDLPPTDNSNNQSSRMHSSGTKHMDVREMS